MDDSASGRDSNRLCAIVGSQFFHGMLNVGLNGLLGDEETLSYVSISISFDDELRQLYFASS